MCFHALHTVLSLLCLHIAHSLCSILITSVAPCMNASCTLSAFLWYIFSCISGSALIPLKTFVSFVKLMPQSLPMTAKHVASSFRRVVSRVRSAVHSQYPRKSCKRLLTMDYLQFHFLSISICFQSKYNTTRCSPDFA